MYAGQLTDRLLLVHCGKKKLEDVRVQDAKLKTENRQPTTRSPLCLLTTTVPSTTVSPLIQIPL
jgi:hypothetical protein